MSDGAHQVQPHVDMNRPKQSYVMIISHEGDRVPFELTNADTLTQFFTDYNNIRTGVRSYIIDENIQSDVQLVNMPNYLKDLCNLQSLRQNIQKDDDYGVSPVTFLFCHGSGPGPDHPAVLNFGEERFKHIVWACRKSQPKRSDVILQDLICNSELVILMCCAGDQILKDYLSEQGNKIRNILFYNHGEVLKPTHALFLALLMNLIDSHKRLEKDPYPRDLFHIVMDSIITIFKIVKWCNNDKNEFWNFMLDMGCISTYESEKRKQGLPIQVKRFTGNCWKFHYRLFGHTYHDYIPRNVEERIFNEFKTLTLVSAGDTEPLYQNCESVDPLPSDLPLRQALYDYVSRHPEESQGSVESKDTTGPLPEEPITNDDEDYVSGVEEELPHDALLCNLLNQLQNLGNVLEVSND